MSHILTRAGQALHVSCHVLPIVCMETRINDHKQDGCDHMIYDYSNLYMHIIHIYILDGLHVSRIITCLLVST